MAKMRVYELAKEVNKESKEILAYLKENGFEIKSASSNVEEKEIELVKREFLKGSSTPIKENEQPAGFKEAKKETKEKTTEAAKKAKGSGEVPKPIVKPEEKREAMPLRKKKNITAVFNSQYSTQSGSKRNRGEDRKGERKLQRPGAKPFRPEGGYTPIRPRQDRERMIHTMVITEEPAFPVKKEEVKTVEAKVSEAPVKNKVDLSKVEDTPRRKKSFVHTTAKEAIVPPIESAAAEKKDEKKGSRDNSRRKKNIKQNENTRKQERSINLEKTKLKKHVKQAEPKTVKRGEDDILTLIIPDRLTVKELCEKMQMAPSEVIKALFLKGKMVTLNQDITYEQAEEIALEFNCICEPEEKVDVIAELLKDEEEVEANLVTRPPVVCVMGHVDHGKTSLLDAIRQTNVTGKEAGGITQKIGAYMVNVNGQKITFLDTPGHEAFTAMRMRGASSTDIAILVVAADDGVMPQTIEAINHARAANVEIIVAINKIDKPGANIDRVKKELSEHELVSTDWGGSTEFVPVSAKSGEGIKDLLDIILLTAEVQELKADPKRNARGLVIEAELDKGRGVVATVLVQKGTLHVGDAVAAGKAYGKVRAMIDEHGKRIKKAGPSTPAEILGLSEVPNAGEIFMSMDSDKEARAVAATFVSVDKDRMVEDSRQRVTLDDLFTQIQAGNLKEFNLIVKADVQGSVEAVKNSLEKLSNEEVVVKIIHSGVGAISESDVTLASAGNAVLIGFNVKPDNIAKQRADSEGVDIRLYNVIYNIIEDVEYAMKGMLAPVYEEKIIGHAQIRQVFKASEIGNIAGSYVKDGEILRDCKVRITRKDEQIFEGSLSSLKRFKDNVKEVKAGFECGLVFDGFYDFQVDDEIEAYIMVEKARA